MLITLSEVVNLYKRLATFFKDIKGYPSQWKKGFKLWGILQKKALVNPQ